MLLRCLDGMIRDGRASRLSAYATLSGSSSHMSTYSNAWMRQTSLAGMGARLLARWKGRWEGRGAGGVWLEEALQTEEGRSDGDDVLVARLGSTGMSEARLR